MNAARRNMWGEAGYSLMELLVVLAILGAFLLVSIPNLVRMHETYLLRTNSSGLAAVLKLGRMKAVANNRSYRVELNPTIRNQCRTDTGGNRHIMVVYRPLPSGTPTAEECRNFDRNISVEAVGGTPNPKVAFRSSGMAEPNSPDKAPNWYLVKSRNRRTCQLVCVNVMGAVFTNPPSPDCSAPYGATNDTPCPPPS